ncbi:uncharacterized protein LOC131696067 [Topomyia yanbarensis]|uniref:uncharacterized protein LOC131696067 n=1 Tax=Topomyia yanbarensis TaxID=2498891 RepID=UPI00273BD01C|nr:uncharacterized protein LOC131696067 [Topomyia yanbarensis]
MEKSELEKLWAKREVVFAKAKWELSVAESLSTRNPSFDEVHERRNKLVELAGNFDRIQTTIEECTSNLEDVASVFNYRLQFDEVYFQIKGIYTAYLDETQDRMSNCSVGTGESVNDLRDAIRALVETQQALILHQIQPTAASATGQVSNHNNPLNVKLPQLNIPVFKGERKNWHSFKDLFVSTIHSRTDLNDSLKMQYLLSYLDGEAKKMVSSFPISDANYKEAWETLEAHYNKKKYTVFGLVREFIDQPSTSTALGLKKLVATSDDVIRQLKALGNEFESRDPWLIHLLLEKVDKETRSLWAQKIIDVDNPTFTDFLEFLQKRCDALETCTAFTKRTSQGDVVKKEYPKAHGGEKVQSFLTNASLPTCAKCSKDHPIYHCDRFKEMDVSARRDEEMSKSVCRSTDCKQRHHTLLCTQDVKKTEKEPEQHQPNRDTGTVPAVASANVNAAQTVGDKYEFTLLPTAVGRVEGSDGKLHDVRILVDCGSQVSLITEACVRRLGLRRSNASLVVTGVSAEVVGKTAGKVTLVISSRFENTTKLIAQAYVLGKLTAALPCQRFSVSNMPYLEGLQLADPQFNKPASTDIILGADMFLSILQSGQIKDHNGNPMAQRSIFGWMVTGKISKQECAHTYHSVINLQHEVDIDRTLRLFWEDQELHSLKQHTKDELTMIELFNSTLTRSKEGRFIVRLPMDDSKLKLGNSLVAATRRLRCIVRRFDSDNDFKQRYISFMREYQELGHMMIIPPAEIDVDWSKSYYLPHHGVIKEDSTTTKLRVVFYGSSATTTGASLNDILLDTPNIKADLFKVLLRFRTYPIVFIADIEKMYRQVLVHHDDTDYMRADSVDEAKQLIRQINEILGEAGFTLRKWSSNSGEVLESLSDTINSSISIQFPDERNAVKALGTHWVPREDV